MFHIYKLLVRCFIFALSLRDAACHRIYKLVQGCGGPNPQLMHAGMVSLLAHSSRHFSLLAEDLAVSAQLGAMEMYRIVAVFVTKILNCFVVRNQRQ